MIEAVENEIAEFERHSKAAVVLTVTGKIETETDSQRIAIQSVTRAALANVSKHAKAENVAVRLRGAGRTITLEVEDDGCGFAKNGAATKGRFGLSGMRERVELLGGTLEVASRRGGPTKITATLNTWRPPAE